MAQAWKEPFNPLLSYFNEHVWSEFVLSARIPQTVCRYNRLDPRSPMQVVDAIRCRRQLLAHLSPCVFSVWDDITEVVPGLSLIHI